MEHDRGPFNGRAEVTGAVLDRKARPCQAPALTVRAIAPEDACTAHADADGQFTSRRVPPGEYEVEMTASDSESASRNFTLKARDRAVLSSADLRWRRRGTRCQRGDDWTSASARVQVGGIGERQRRRYRRRLGGWSAAAWRQFAHRCRRRSPPMVDDLDEPCRVAGNTSEGCLARTNSHRPSGAGPGAARALLVPRSPLHQSGNHHRPERRRQHHHSAWPIPSPPGAWPCWPPPRTARWAAALEPQSLPGFLRRPRSARHAHPGRPRLHPRRHLQLLRRARRRQPELAARRLVLAGRRHRRQNRRRRFRPRRRRRSSRWKPSASANSS